MLDFLATLESDRLAVPSVKSIDELVEFYDNDSCMEDKEWFVDGLIGLSYFCFNEPWETTDQKDRLNALLDQYLVKDHHLIDSFISALKPLLIKSVGINSTALASSGRRKIESSRIGLRPRIGFEESFAESKWREWRDNGGLRSIGLFYIILRNLKKRDISTNLPWISPGILNMLDDTTRGSENVRIYGIVLLGKLLQALLNDKDTYKFSFNETGLQKIYEPILTNILYQLPPSFSPEETICTWKVAYPVLQKLFQVEASGNIETFKTKLGRVFSETILQLTIPRIGLDHPDLSLWILEYCREIVLLLGKDMTLYLQRIIYVLGEIYLRNSFITLHMSVLHQCLDLLIVVCQQSIPESVTNHRYDILACTILCYEKCYNEGTLSSDISRKCRSLLGILNALGCSFKDELAPLTKRKPLIDLFVQISV